jgi:hypothetical protein
VTLERPCLNRIGVSTEELAETISGGVSVRDSGAI